MTILKQHTSPRRRNAPYMPPNIVEYIAYQIWLSIKYTYSTTDPGSKLATAQSMERRVNMLDMTRFTRIIGAQRAMTTPILFLAAQVKSINVRTSSIYLYQ